MSAGRYRCRVELLRPTATKDGMGGTNTQYSVAGIVWAGIEPLKGVPLFEEKRQGTLITVKIVMRYRSDVSEKWRVKYQGVAYEIDTPIDVGMRHRQLECMCRVIK